MRIYDISMTITPDMPVYKGRAEKMPHMSVDSDFTTGTAYETRINMNLHTGTHIDAPLHFVEDGGTIDGMPLEKTVRKCRVIDVTHVAEGICAKDIEGKTIKAGDFVLLKSRNSFEDILEGDFVYLDSTGAQYLKDKGIAGVGSDALGIERAQPEHVDLGAFVQHFVEDYRSSHPLNDDRLEASKSAGPLTALFDRRQLQQVVTVLVHNALVYGRVPDQPARVGIRAYADDHGHPVIDVTDRGPGIPEAVAAQLFRPFFTTSGQGTGLGLYIARELCQANQASLDYVPVPGGGACFRIRLTGARAIATA